LLLVVEWPTVGAFGLEYKVCVYGRGVKLVSVPGPLQAYLI